MVEQRLKKKGIRTCKNASVSVSERKREKERETERNRGKDRENKRIRKTCKVRDHGIKECMRNERKKIREKNREHEIKE